MQFWNNGADLTKRMYVLESTLPFVQKNRLRQGDALGFYRDPASATLYIGFAKGGH